MASLEHFNKSGRDCFRLRFLLDGRRQCLALGDFDEGQATDAKEHVEHLIAQAKRDKPPNAKASKWLDGLPTKVHDRLAVLELVEPRKRTNAPRTVLKYMRAYITGRTDWQKPENYRQAVGHLETYLGRDAPLGSLSKGDVERWQRWMISDPKGPDLSPNTAGQNVKRCRQMMRQAVSDGLIEVNPFAGVKIDLRSDKSKNRFVDLQAAYAILDSCPDQQWRTIVALCRFGGLRCPSEVLLLKWSDIVWDRERMTVTAPKTKRYGKGQRVVPLWPELRRELDAAWDEANDGDRYVITRYRDSESNLRTTFNKIVARAGVPEFPKPFMALRKSRRTEVERLGRHQPHVVNEWFGHDSKTADEYYLDVIDDDFNAAMIPMPSPVGTSVGTSPGEQEPPQAITKQKKPGRTGLLMATDGVGSPRKYTPQDSTATDVSPGDSRRMRVDGDEVGVEVGTQVGTSGHILSDPDAAKLLSMFAAMDAGNRDALLQAARQLSDGD
jgi:integrase